MLLWCAAGAVLVQLVREAIRALPALPLSPIFRLLLEQDGHANVLLLALAVAAFALRGRPGASNAVLALGARPWLLAAALFPLLCAASLQVYRAYPLSMDEYAQVFQAAAFAAGKLAGSFPADLVDRLVPVFFHNQFLIVSKTTGEVSTSYWPSFSLMLAPFSWLGAPWALNPVLGALTLPALHALTRRLTGSPEAAAWAVMLTLASPAFVANAISLYPLQAHLLLNLLFALLLLEPSARRALAAGLLGSIALTLSNPLPHLLFAAAFVAWLAVRDGALRHLAALAAGYLPLALLLGFGWREHLLQLAAPAAAAAAASAEAARIDAAGALRRAWAAFADVVSLPSSATLAARAAGLAKLWTWAALGLLVYAAAGFHRLAGKPAARVLAASLALSFIGYFFVPFDQGHGWGYRYLRPAWFVLPVLAGACLAAPADGTRQALRAMAAWGIVLSLVASNGLRLLQIDAFIDRHLAQVPPLDRPVGPQNREIVLINIRHGFYTQDMVQNDPFLRSPRIVMVREGAGSPAELMARRFPRYRKAAEGPWGELWIAPR